MGMFSKVLAVFPPVTPCLTEIFTPTRVCETLGKLASLGLSFVTCKMGVVLARSSLSSSKCYISPGYCYQ